MKTFGWIALMVSAAVMVSPAVAQGRNDVSYRGTQTVYSPVATYDSNCGDGHAVVYPTDRDRDDDRRVWDRDADRGHRDFRR